MSRFDNIDLSRLPAPEVVQAVDAEAIFERKRDALVAARPELAEVLSIEADPLVIYLQRDAYDEALLRARINDGARSVMPAFATGADLEHLAALFGVGRQVVVPADPGANPPVEAVLETDAELRSRLQLALEAQTSAGTIGAYLFFARSAHPDVKDAAVSQPIPGTVRITVLSRTGDGTAPAPTLAAVNAALNAEDVRPLCDTVEVVSAVVVPFDITAELTYFAGPDQAVVEAAARAALDAYLEDRRLIGQDVTRSGIIAALHQPGVQDVDLTVPAANLVIDDASAATVGTITITNGGVDA